MQRPFYHRLFDQEDIAPMVVFRWVFGLLCALESWGAIATGWLERTLIEPQFTFSFMDFAWLQPLPGWGMYAWYVVMGLAGIGIMVGYRYRWSLGLFTLLWTCTYLMQKSSYNNHYYLLVVLCVMMLCIPAHRAGSLDAKRNPAFHSLLIPVWCRWFLIAQFGLVYTFAATNKIQADWLALRPVTIWFNTKTDFFLIGPLFETEWIKYFVAYGGIAYDLLITPVLLWRPTRKVGFALSIFFNLFNSATFHIGIFPFLMIGTCVLFFPPSTIARLFFKRETPAATSSISQGRQRMILWGTGVFLLVQLLMPLRHHLIAGDVNWTEEGHRMSWRMMLRSKSGQVSFRVESPDLEKADYPNLDEFLSKKQKRAVATHPDMIWQFSQRLADHYRQQGYSNPRVYAHVKVSLNGHPPQMLIDPKVDLAAVKWSRFKHEGWILDQQPEEEGNHAH